MKPRLRSVALLLARLIQSDPLEPALYRCLVELLLAAEFVTVTGRDTLLSLRFKADLIAEEFGVPPRPVLCELESEFNWENLGRGEEGVPLSEIV